MAYNAIIEVEARRELEESAIWYEQQSKGLGIRFIDSFLSVLDYIEQHAESFPIIEGEYRQAVMKLFPFVIIYKISGSNVKINAVFHTGRNPKMKFR